MNELIQVEAEDHDGELRPTAFIWEGRRYAVHHHGRQWNEKGVRHFLVMTADRRPYELVYSEESGQWRLHRSPTELGSHPLTS
ncbi:MAG: hypothetical protein WBR18_00540 [Anaerolineales bacterium]